MPSSPVQMETEEKAEKEKSALPESLTLNSPTQTNLLLGANAEEQVLASQTTIEHYECCHKPLPEYTNVDSLREVHEALGFI